MPKEQPTDEEKIAAVDKFGDALEHFCSASAADRRVPEPPQVRRARKAARDAARDLLQMLLGRKPTAEELDRIVPS